MSRGFKVVCVMIGLSILNLLSKFCVGSKLLGKVLCSDKVDEKRRNLQ